MRGTDPHDGSPPEATAEDAYSAWFALANGCTAAHDTGFAAAVPTTPRATLTQGSTGSIELTADTTLVVHHAGEIRRRSSFRPHCGARRLLRCQSFLAEVAEALRTGTQIAPSFDDGVAVARTMDQLRATAS